MCSAGAVSRPSSQRQSCSSGKSRPSSLASTCLCGAKTRRCWIDAVGGCGRSSASPHLDGPLASAIRSDPSLGSDPATGFASSSPTACHAFSSPLELAGPTRPQCWVRTSATACQCRWRSRFSGYTLTKEELVTTEAFSTQCHIPLSWIRRARIVCLLLTKPASLLPLLVDDLVEALPRSHGCTKERSRATSFEWDSSLRIPWGLPAF